MFQWPDIYVICLGKTVTARCKPTIQNLKSCNYPGKIIQFDAITPDNTPNIKELLHPYAKLTVLKQKEREVHNQLCHINQVGCYMSHVSLWEKCIELGKNIIIAEDDVYNNSICKELAQLPNAPKDADIITFLCSANIEKVKITDSSFFKINNFTGAGVYMITPHASKILLKNAVPIIHHVDHYMSSLVENGDLKMYGTENCVSQIIENSVLNHGISIPKIVKLTDANTKIKHKLVVMSTLFAIISIVFIFYVIFHKYSK